MTSATAEQAKLNGPAMAPPPGVIPNFVDPPNLDHAVILVLTLCMSFSTMAVLLRLFTKLFILRKVVFEDYVVVLGWLLAIAEAVPSGLCTRQGGGVHQWNVRLKDFFQMLYWVNISSILYGPTLFVIKFSILLQYLRIFVPNRKANMPMFVAVHTVNVAIFIFYLIDTAFHIFLCRPREKFWNRLITTGSCYNFNASIKATGLFNVISDFAILMLPIPSIWKLQVPLKKKLGILAVFATGVLACVASIVRSYLTFKIVKSDDVSYETIVMGFWTIVEIDTGIIISCLPVLPRLFRAFGPRIYSAFSLKSKTNGDSEPKPSLTPMEPMSGKKKPDGYVNLYSMQTEVSGESSSLHEHESYLPGRKVTNDSSRTSLAPNQDHPAPGWEGMNMNAEKKKGRILRTTHIETDIKSEMNAVNMSRADLERQQLSW